MFPVSISVCPSFLSRRASRNCSKGLEETFLDRVVNESAIVDFCLRNHLTGGTDFYNDKQSIEHVQINE